MTVETSATEAEEFSARMLRATQLRDAGVAAEHRPPNSVVRSVGVLSAGHGRRAGRGGRAGRTLRAGVAKVG